MAHPRNSLTNPPFSLFREYLAQLVQYGKMFLIVGSQNAVAYKEIFPLIKDNRMWLGVTPKGQDMLFDVPEGYAQELVAIAKEGSAYRVVEGVIKGIYIRKSHSPLEPRTHPPYIIVTNTGNGRWLRRHPEKHTAKASA